MSFRNRCRIAGAGGMINLSIPLEKGRDQKTLLKDVIIADRGDWQGQHWKTILSCYNRSPWFEFYRDELEKLYRKPFHFLLDWNLSCFEWSLGILQMPFSFSLTEVYQKNYDEGNWADWRGKILPGNRTGEGSFNRKQDGGIRTPDDHPVSGIRNSGDRVDKIRKPDDPVDGFREAHDPVNGFREAHDPVNGFREARDPVYGIRKSEDPADRSREHDAIRYRQVFEERTGFLPNLSILDLLFCEGKNARSYLLK